MYHVINRFTLRLATRELITRLEHIVQAVIPDSEVGKSHGAELSFVLPLNTKKSFDALFDNVDKEVRGNKDIIDFGISTPTLEHIFYGFHRSLYKRNAALEGSEFAGIHDFESEAESRGFRKSRYHEVNLQNKSRHHLYQEFKALAYIRFAKKANDICSFTPLMLLPMMLLLFCVLYSNDAISGTQNKLTKTTAISTMVGVCFNIIPAGFMIEYINDREVTKKVQIEVICT